MIKNYSQKRTLVDVDTFLEKTGRMYLMCIDAGMLYAIRKLVKDRLMWQSSWAKIYYENTYETASVEEMDEINDVIGLFLHESEVIEMCNQALIDALNGIASNIRLSSCCWEGGPGMQEIDGDLYYGTEDPLSEPTSFGPGEEFETEDAWEAHKCLVANGIINGLIGSLNGISVLTLAGLIASSVLAAVVGIGLIVVPPVAIILAILGAGLTFAFFSALATELSDNKELLVCLLYNSETAQDAYDQLEDAIEDLAIDIGVLEIQLGPVRDLIMQMCPIDTLNTLYRNVGLPEIPGEVVDCSEACECPEYTVLWGTYDPVTGYLTSELYSSCHRAAIAFNGDWTWPSCGEDVTVSVSIVYGSIGSGDGQGYKIWDSDGNVIWNSNTAPTWPVTAEAYYFKKDGPATEFQVELTIS